MKGLTGEWLLSLFLFLFTFYRFAITSHLNEYSLFACLQQFIRCILFVNVNESLFDDV